jgi:hypothetical protein
LLLATKIALHKWLNGLPNATEKTRGKLGGVCESARSLAASSVTVKLPMNSRRFKCAGSKRTRAASDISRSNIVEKISAYRRH